MPHVTVRGPEGPPVVHHVRGERIRIGRGSENEIVLADKEVSRLHAELRSEDGLWYVLDRGSRNGTSVCGRAVRAARLVRPGDELQIGLHVLTIAVDPDASTGDADTTWEAGRIDRDPEVEQPILVGESEAIARVRELVHRIAPLEAPVLVTGESGTGKELVAHLLHRCSGRAAGPFVVVNCPSLPASLADAELFGVERGVATGVEPRPGKLEAADGGTLFLDEVGDLDAAVQAKLLRFLQDGVLDRVGARCPTGVDVRVVAATNRDMDGAMRDGQFRRDLYHRLAGVRVHLPPLRERRQDLPLLVEHFLRRSGRPGVEVSAAALGLLERHDYPGNVRELAHAVKLASYLTSGSVVGPDDLPDHLRADPDWSSGSSAERLHDRIVKGGECFWMVIKEPFMRRELGREEVDAFLALARERAGGSYRAVARLLGIEDEYRRLVNFLNHHGLDRDKRPADGAGSEPDAGP